MVLTGSPSWSSNSTDEITRWDPAQNLQNHVEPSAEPRKIEETDERPGETREEWVISIKDKMEQVRRDHATNSWDKLCIYKVPRSLQENDKKAYLPQTVSLGPYHHGKEHLLPMELHKWRALNMFMARTYSSIEMYIDAMEKLEERVRACYEGIITFSSNKFIEMLLLDGCFVLEILKGADEEFKNIGYAANDPVFAMGGLMHSIQRDMFLLENQLPLFVLNRLLDLQPDTNESVAQLAVRFFKPLMITSERETEGKSKDLLIKFDPVHEDPLFDRLRLFCSADSVRLADNGKWHCLDAFHRSLFHSIGVWNRGTNSEYTSKVENQQQQMIHCVTELRKTGVKFVRKETGQPWDIEFNNGYLKIPKLLIHDGTKSLFLNLIAFEQCCTHSRKFITSYIIFMDNLINSSEDVSYLHHHDIIEHWLGSDSEVADLFNRLCKEVIYPKDGYLSQLSCEVNDYYSRYYNRKWNYLKATLRHKYFNNPWAYFSFSAAVILLILTFSQSFFAAYEFFKPAS